MASLFPSCVIWLVVLLLIFLSYPYLSKPSRYYSSEKLCRPLSHHLVWSSFVYFLLTIYFSWTEDVHLTILSIIVGCGSVQYHRHSEMAFFNMDNIFATSMALICAWAFLLAIIRQQYDILIFSLVMYAFIISIFTICKLPATEIMDKDSRCLCRVENPNYPYLHSLWHLASMIGPLFASWYFTEYHNGDEPLSEMIFGVHESVTLDRWGFFPIVPSSILLISIGINIFGNFAGIMPLA